MCCRAGLPPRQSTGNAIHTLYYMVIVLLLILEHIKMSSVFVCVCVKFDPPCVIMQRARVRAPLDRPKILTTQIAIVALVAAAISVVVF